MRNILLSHIIFILSTVYIFVVLRRKQFWNDKAYYKLPIAIVLYVIVISLPPIIGFGTDIHTPYSLFYFLLNYPVMNVFNIGSIEHKLFGEHSLYSSNFTFALMSVLFWLVASFVIGAVTYIIINTKSYNKANSSDA